MVFVFIVRNMIECVLRSLWVLVFVMVFLLSEMMLLLVMVLVMVCCLSFWKYVLLCLVKRVGIGLCVVMICLLVLMKLILS